MDGTPQIRVRIAHSSTMKEGWRLSETTVEWSGPTDDPSWRSKMEETMKSAYNLGELETLRRKHQAE